MAPRATSLSLAHQGRSYFIHPILRSSGKGAFVGVGVGTPGRGAFVGFGVGTPRKKLFHSFPCILIVLEFRERSFSANLLPPTPTPTSLRTGIQFIAQQGNRNAVKFCAMFIAGACSDVVNRWEYVSTSVPSQGMDSSPSHTQ